MRLSILQPVSDTSPALAALFSSPIMLGEWALPQSIEISQAQGFDPRPFDLQSLPLWPWNPLLVIMIMLLQCVCLVFNYSPSRETDAKL